MDLTQLRMFCLVADSGSMARAAEQLQRVPSNLTTRLRQLELELGTDLFIREKQRLRLSPAGHNFLGYARKILALSDEALTMSHSGAPGGQLVLGTEEPAALLWLPELLAQFHSRFPQVAISLKCAAGSQLLDEVSHGDLAAALVSCPIDNEALHHCRIVSDRLVLITSRQHPAVNQAKDLDGAVILQAADASDYRSRLTDWSRGQSTLSGPWNTVNSLSTLVASVAGGTGAAFLPQSVLNAIPGGSQVQVHLLPETVADIAVELVWRRDAFGPNVEALKKLMIKRFS
ncbi:LysR family transcriptional regulator [Lonsdalea quercina]|uniref:DNA-binding transcriptional regulator, LysR family n=1 Tax=Lonsdalea quercina TaxID=71657 RepID=A0A1H4BQD0_9GAMM|nr:LysR family transcriptional regulator [Lonsdalea quercina]SEA50333.1 DNA-binding transcriptional regulator, LysR family [Lonsdalea quercina]